MIYEFFYTAQMYFESMIDLANESHEYGCDKDWCVDSQNIVTYRSEQAYMSLWRLKDNDHDEQFVRSVYICSQRIFLDIQR